MDQLSVPDVTYEVGAGCLLRAPKAITLCRRWAPGDKSPLSPQNQAPVSENLHADEAPLI